MATQTFVAGQNKTVNVSGKLFSITFPSIPAGIDITINDITVTAGQPITLTENSTISVVNNIEPSTITVSHENLSLATVNGTPVLSGQEISLLAGENTANFIGAVAIPAVTVNGDGITQFTVNSVEYDANQLPYTFTPSALVTNQVFMKGEAGEGYSMFLSGTNIATVTVNDVEVELPYKVNVNQNQVVAISGDEYVVDFETIGARITQNGTLLTDGNSQFHDVIKITENTFFNVDGTHNLNFDGDYLKTVSVNGVLTPIDKLPITIKNSKMDVNVVADGFAPSIINVTGNYIEDGVLDGKAIPLDDDGHFAINFDSFNQVHNLTINGTQPREFVVTVDNNEATVIKVNGTTIEDGDSYKTFADVLIDAKPLPIPINFETSDTVKVDINGKFYDTNDFAIKVDSATEIDVYTQTCNLTIDYSDNSYTIVVPQTVVTITAPHRDGWIFDGWSSNNVGIKSPKTVSTQVDLNGRNSANLVCHYQQYLTCNKPSIWSN